MFGMGMMDDLGSHFQPHFVLETDSTSLTDRRFSATAATHAQQGSSGADVETFSMPPLPWC